MSTAQTGSDARRLYSLDAARAVAALAVVFQHWEHFLAVPAFAAAKPESPLYWLFQPFYEKGARAVTFFFCLSGFIFFWLYARKVHAKSVGPETFAMLRLSRLYPLHLATLLVVALLQWPLTGILGEPFVYSENDAKHFILNILLVQYWGFESGYSFNGPSWSVSVEAFLYVAFFLACRFIRPSLWLCVALAAVGVVLARFSILAGAAAPFFLGGAVFHIYRAVVDRWTSRMNFAFVTIVVLAWIALPWLTAEGRLGSLFGDAGTANTAEGVVRIIAQRQFELVLFPLTVLALALSEAVWRRVPWRGLHDIGNMSYGIYLLHFPLQLVFLAGALGLGLPSDTFLHPMALLLFIAALLALAALSYHAFEKPVMQGLRGMWTQAVTSRRHAAAAARAPTG